jgi:YfiH family protein
MATGPPRPRYVFTTRHQGDLAVAQPDVVVEPRRRDVVDLPWTWLRQVHGREVVTVTRPAEWTGATADAAVVTVPGAALAVHTADCAPVVLLAAGMAGVAHVGWRGLAAGVVEAAVERIVEAGAEAGGLEAVIGPCIRPECYEFGPDDLDRVAAAVGEEVRATTAAGAPALDLAAGIRAVLDRAGVGSFQDTGDCTACGRDWFSHRARGETGRQAAVVWLEHA